MAPPESAPKGPKGGGGHKSMNGASRGPAAPPPDAPRAPGQNKNTNTNNNSKNSNKSQTSAAAGLPPAAEPQTIAQPPEPRGPAPGVTLVPVQYTFEQKIRQLQKTVGSDPTREDNYRLQGVQLIDNVRRHLQLPVRTFDTAVNYYHRFRLRHREAEYNFQDSALASLFLSCKVEDTIKKSKEILCAAYNLKNPDHPTTPDDKVFDQPSRVLVGLERLILESIGFDFRTRYPQKYLAKLVRLILGTGAEARDFFAVAYDVSLDMYKTFVPIKQTSLGMCLAAVELTALVLDRHVDAVRRVTSDEDGDDGDARTAQRRRRFHVPRDAVLESLLDLLELYTQFHGKTALGARFELSRWIDIKIRVNEELDSHNNSNNRNRNKGGAEAALSSRYEYWCQPCEDGAKKETAAAGGGGGGGAGGAGGGKKIPSTTTAAAAAVGFVPPATTSSVSSIRLGTRSSDTTVRFIFNSDQAGAEARRVAEFFKDDFEEYETEVEEPIPEPDRFEGGGGGGGSGSGAGSGGGQRDRGHHGGGPIRGGGGRGRHDGPGWQPYHRNHRPHHPHDRRGRRH